MSKKNLPAKNSATALAPAVLDQLETGLDSALNQTSRDAGDIGNILKMSKSGEWLYGADEIDVQEGSLWAVNPLSIEVGYVCWIDGSGEPPEERMAGLTDAPIDAGTLPKIEGSQRGWQRQMAVQMLCLNGDDEGVEVRYSVSSKGGLKALRGLVDAIRKAVAKGDGNIVPVVQLDSSWYKHKEYGRIYNPVLDVQKFVPLDELPEPEDDDDDEPAGNSAAAEPAAAEGSEGSDPADEGTVADDEPEPAPRRRRRRPAA